MGERVVHLVKRDPAGDHVVETKLARFDKANEKREVTAHLSGPVEAPEHALLGKDKRRGRKGQIDIGPRNTDDHTSSATPRHIEGLTHRLRSPDGLEGVI